MGQPLDLLLLFGEVCHSWSSPLSHFHHTFSPFPLEISKGVNSPFLVGCHSLASSGFNSASDFPKGGFLGILRN